MRSHTLSAFLGACFTLLAASVVSPQVNPQGISQGSTQIVAGPVSIDMATGSMVVRISVQEKAGGIPFRFSLINNSGNQGAVNNYQSFSGVMSSGEMGGFGRPSPTQCRQPLNTTFQYGTGIANQWYVTDETGAHHPFTFPPIRQGPSSCAGSIGPLTSVASDGSGYTATVTGSNSMNAGLAWVVSNKEGMSISSTSPLTDADGNTIYSGANGWVGTLGQTALTGVYGGNLQTGGHNGNPDQYYNTDANGSAQYYTVNYNSQRVKTVFTCTAPQAT